MDAILCNKLLAEISSGSDEALAKLYREMSTPIFAYALSIVRNKHLAEDVMQDTFIKIKLNASKYKTNVNPNGWVYKIVKNLSFDALKKIKHETPMDIQLDSSKNCDTEEVIDNLIFENSLRILSTTERQIIFLFFVAGNSQVEIAKILKLPLSTVNWKYRSSIKKISKQLKLGGVDYD